MGSIRFGSGKKSAVSMQLSIFEEWRREVHSLTTFNQLPADFSAHRCQTLVSMSDTIWVPPSSRTRSLEGYSAYFSFLILLVFLLARTCNFSGKDLIFYLFPGRLAKTIFQRKFGVNYFIGKVPKNVISPGKSPNCSAHFQDKNIVK